MGNSELKGGHGGGQLARVKSEFIAAVKEAVRREAQEGRLPAGRSFSIGVPEVIRMYGEAFRRCWTPDLNAKVSEMFGCTAV